MALTADGELPAPTHAAIKDLFSAIHDAREIAAYEAQLAPLALSFDHHHRQLNILMIGHIPIVLSILLMAAIGGHRHITQVVLFVYVPLFVSLMLSLFLFGVQIKFIAISRTFALAMFLIGLWTTISLIYAVYTQIRMREWYDILLLALQGIDVAIAIGYFYTTEQLAGIGGEASAICAEVHYRGLAISPLAHKLGHAADINRDATRASAPMRLIHAINKAIS